MMHKPIVEDGSPCAAAIAIVANLQNYMLSSAVCVAERGGFIKALLVRLAALLPDDRPSPRERALYTDPSGERWQMDCALHRVAVWDTRYFRTPRINTQW